MPAGSPAQVADEESALRVEDRGMSGSRADLGKPSSVLTTHVGRRAKWPYLFCLPCVVVIIGIFGYPLIEVIRTSFYAGTASQLVFDGVQNYVQLYHDPIFVHSALNNGKLLLTVPITTAVALGIAMLINTQLRGWRMYRRIAFLPFVLPSTAMGIAFSYILAQNGVLNGLLNAVGLSGLSANWLGSSNLVVWSLGFVIIWQQLGFGVVVFCAALLNVPRTLVEAAMIDGASSFQISLHVLLPNIKRIIGFFVVVEALTVMSSLFTYVFVLTNGGPANASSVMDYYVYQQGFQNGSVGLAASAAVVLLALATILVSAYFVLRHREAKQGGDL